jgi:chromate transport protein ChrA
MAKTNDAQHHTAGLMALWVGVVLPLIITAAEMETNYVLVRQACAAERNLALYAVVIVALILTALTGLASALIWRKRGATWPSESADIVTRARFISVLGIMSSAISFTLILAHGIATLKFDPCQL